MSHLETLYLPHLPPSLPIHISLFRDLRNAAFLREQLLAGNSAFEYAFVDASMVGALRLFLLLCDVLTGRVDLVKDPYSCGYFQSGE